MSDKTKGLYKKYEVTRVDGKPIDNCIVLEFKDPIARDAIHKWASDMYLSGHKQLFYDVQKEILKHEQRT